MDINAAVARMDQLSTEIDHVDPDGYDLPGLAEEMASTWDGIRAWLDNGGMLPDRWAKATDAARVHGTNE